MRPTNWECGGEKRAYATTYRADPHTAESPGPSGCRQPVGDLDCWPDVIGGIRPQVPTTTTVMMNSASFSGNRNG